jgi:hypothetical protein
MVKRINQLMLKIIEGKWLFISFLIINHFITIIEEKY